MEPLIDINIAVYNQASYLRTTLNSVLQQQTTFPFRLLVGDDCSTDGSIDILKEYEQKYADKIKVIYQPKNIGLNSAERNGIILLKNSTAKYIALLDGDDYWCDENKLQKQVDFLEANPDYSICFHRVFELEEDKEPVLSKLNTSTIPQTYTIEDLSKGSFIHTLSVVFRNTYKDGLPDWFGQAFAGDYVLHMLNSSFGKIYYMPDPMGIYRKFVGAWGTQNEVNRYINWYKTLALLIKHFEGKEFVKNLRDQQADCLVYLYNNALDELTKQEPLVKAVLDIATIKSTTDLTKFSASFLLTSFLKRLGLVLRHNPIANRIRYKKNEL